MLSHWNKLFNTDCEVYKVGERYVYPIFRNGSSSLEKVCEKIIANEQLNECNNIHVLIRDPAERFESGINEYCKRIHDLDIKETLQKVTQGTLMDRHFSPQWTWLLHLYKFYKGNVTLRAFDDIGDYCDVHVNKFKDKTKVAAPKQFIEIDNRLTRYFDKTIELEELVKEFRNVLP